MDVVRYGQEGYGVKLLQYALSRAGMDVGNLDGFFGRRTVRALQQFQRSKGLAADAVAGKLTWAALYPYITGYALHREGPDRTATLPLDLPVVTDHIPCSSFLTGLMVQGLVMRYPSIRAFEAGRSVMGQRILALSMGSGRRQVGCVGPHGAGGWACATVLLRFMEDYAAAYSAGGALGGIPARTLYERTTLHMLPLVNPDGTDLVTGALDPADSFFAQAAALAAHYPETPFPAGWESDLAGVDLRLQYPKGWAAARRARFAQGFTRPGPAGYVGSEPLIVPESRTVAQWTRDHAFERVLTFDEGFRAWFAETMNGHAILLNASRTLPFDRLYGENLALLVRSL